jgi:hypothetical protein
MVGGVLVISHELLTKEIVINWPGYNIGSPDHRKNAEPALMPYFHLEKWTWKGKICSVLTLNGQLFRDCPVFYKK